jgi:hypothetical protein
MHFRRADATSLDRFQRCCARGGPQWLTGTSLPTYVRAWAEQKDGESGEIATRYLRAGTTGLPWR